LLLCPVIGVALFQKIGEKGEAYLCQIAYSTSYVYSGGILFEPLSIE